MLYEVITQAVNKIYGFIVLGALLSASGPAAAYECTPATGSVPLATQAWNTRCIVFKIGNQGTLLDGIAGETIVSESFNVWSTPACTDMTFMYGGRTDEPYGFDINQISTQENLVVVMRNNFV